MPLALLLVGPSACLVVFLRDNGDLALNVGNDPEPLVINTASLASETPKKVLILMSDTGGGHKASAQAISAALEELYQNRLVIETVDIWTDHAKWPFNDAVKTYQYAAKHPMVWKMMYTWANDAVAAWMLRRLTAATCWDRFEEYMQRESPDLIISVHPLCQHLPLRIACHMQGGLGKRSVIMGVPEARRKNYAIPFVTVVTDLGGCHKLWFHKRVDALYVPSDAIENLARRSRIPQEKLRKYGLPIRPGFKVRVASQKDALRADLGLAPGVRTALVVGGGDGIGRIGSITKELANALSDDGGGSAQIVVVCGKNEQVKAELEAQEWPEHVQVTVLGFVRNMDEWMGAVDCIITKAGPGTIAEACASGLPIMISAFLPGQEAGNVPFVVKGGFGEYSTKPKVIAKTVSKWLTNKTLLADMSAKSSAAGRPEATKAIAADIGELLFRDCLDEAKPKKSGSLFEVFGQRLKDFRGALFSRLRPKASC